MLPLDAAMVASAPQASSVSSLCAMIAEELGLGHERAERVALAGRLHDVGKVNVPRSVLEKPGPLDPAEWEHVRRHPELGARMLTAREFDDVRPWVLFHHERPDGRGYPFGLKAPDIPLEAAIVGVCDAWSALTSDRPYRRALRSHKAATVLVRGAGTQWDERCVGALLRVYERALGVVMPLAPGGGRPRPHAAARAPRAA